MSTDPGGLLAAKRVQLEQQLEEMSAPPQELGSISFGKRVGEGTSQAVDRLEKSGLCARRPNPADRRSSIVQLTDTGSALTREAGRVFDEELAARIAAPLTTAQLGHLATALAALRTATPGRAGTTGQP